MRIEKRKLRKRESVLCPVPDARATLSETDNCEIAAAAYNEY
jgi:hypothetical protein